jgi:hypothetical protein
MMPLPQLGERKMPPQAHGRMRPGWHDRSCLAAVGALATSVLLGNLARAADIAPAADATSPPASTTMTSAPPRSPESVEWTVSVAGGPVFVTLATPAAWPLSFGSRSTAWQVELQRHSGDSPFLSGVTLEGTYDPSGGQQMLGVDAFSGMTWRHRHWSLEVTVGAGVEAAQRLDDTVGIPYQLGVYAQGALAAAVPVSSSLAVLVRLGVHLTPTHNQDWFAASTIGLRYTLP